MTLSKISIFSATIGWILTQFWEIVHQHCSTLFNYVQLCSSMFNFVQLFLNFFFFLFKFKICLTLLNFVSLCSTMFNYVSLLFLKICSTLFYFAQLSSTVVNIVRLFSMFNCVQHYFNFRQFCSSLLNFAQLCSILFNFVQLYSTLFNFVQLCSTLFNFVQLCSTLFNVVVVLKQVTYWQNHNCAVLHMQKPFWKSPYAAVEGNLFDLRMTWQHSFCCHKKWNFHSHLWPSIKC